MPELRQKYGLRFALRPSNAVEAVTYMDEQAIREELNAARTEQRDARFDCVNALNEEKIVVLVWALDVQIVMHHKWERPMPRGEGLPPGVDPRHLRMQ